MHSTPHQHASGTMPQRACAVMRRFGTAGMREHVRNGTRLAQVFAALVKAHADLELTCPPSLSLVCFRWAGADEERQLLLLEAVKATGRCFIIHTKLSGKVVLRFACGGIEQTEADVRAAFAVIASQLEALKATLRSTTSC